MGRLTNYFAARLVLLGLVAVGISGCDPFKENRAIQAEQTRIACLDKPCDGDDVPKVYDLNNEVLKLNGQWYVGPKEYFTSLGPRGFEWWEHRLISAAMKRPPELQALVMDGKRYDFSIEIFLTGRGRWPDPGADKPWEGRGWDGRSEELQKQGLRMEREQLRPALERVRFFDAQGKQHRHEYFLATQQQKILGTGLPGIACDPNPDPALGAKPGCTGGFFWQPDVYADFRFSATHAQDWPAIYQEIIRVLNLIKKA